MDQPPDLTAGRMQGFLRPVDGVEIPYALLQGTAPGPRLLVTAGVHGSEFCSIEAALRLMRLDPQKIRGTLLVLPILNLEGFRARSITVMPQDGRDLNQAFPGRRDGTASERLADWLVTRVFPNLDAYLDLHSGDLIENLLPFTLFQGGNEQARTLARVFGLPVAIEVGGEGYTISAAARLGIPSVLAEVGGNGLWDEGGVTRLTGGISRVMAHLGMMATPAAAAPGEPAMMTISLPSAPVGGLWYPAKGLADPVAPGDTLGEIRDIFGAVLATVRAERTGSVLYRLSSLSVNAGDVLFGIGTPR
jgi:predicted deacylase